MATTIDKGFVADNLLLAEVDPGLQGYTKAATNEFFRRLSERLVTNPGVRSLALVDRLPLSLNASDSDVEIPGYVPAESEGMSIYNSDVSPGYFATMGIHTLKGREFTAQDDSAAPRVAVVNQRFVDRFWPGKEAVGRTFRQGKRDVTVVGVVPTGKYVRLGEDPTAHMWFAHAQRWESGMTFVIRANSDPTPLIAILRDEVRALDANLPLTNLRTIDRKSVV